MLAIAQPIVLGLCDFEEYRSQLDLEEDIFVGVVAQRLALTLTTKTPHISFASFATKFEWLLVINYSILRLLIRAVNIFKRIHGYRRLVRFCGKARNLKKKNRVKTEIEMRSISFLLREMKSNRSDALIILPQWNFALESSYTLVHAIFFVNSPAMSRG